MGTAITEKHINILKKLTKNIALALDPDAAGEEAMLRCVEYENSLNTEVKVIILPSHERTGLKVSRFCFGDISFGPLTSEEDAFVIMDKAHELGINFFDTANVYGWKVGEGVTENIVGRWFAQGGGRHRKQSSRPKFSGAWAIGRISRISRRCISARHARFHSNASIPITLTCIKCITWIATHRGMKSGRPWKCWYNRARCSMSARRTLQAGILPKQRKPPRRVTYRDLSVNRVLQLE